MAKPTPRPRSEWVRLIDEGGDILISVRGKHFGIFTWCEEGIGIDEDDPNGKGMQYFPDAETLLSNFLVDGIPLGDIAEQIILRDYS